MKHITIALDDEYLQELERRAAQRGTTVEDYVRGLIQDLPLGPVVVTDEDRARARRKLVELSERSPGRLGNWKWNREELYDRDALPRHEHSRVRGDGEGRGGEEKTTGG